MKYFKPAGLIFLITVGLMVTAVLPHARADVDPTSPAADIKFKKLALKVGKENLTVELADDEIRRERGLMFRKDLKDGNGMLFIFNDSATRSFWMKNTLISLDIGYFDQTKVLIDIQTMAPASPIEERPTIYTSKRPAKYALEVPAGWFAKHHVGLKSQLEMTRP